MFKIGLFLGSFDPIHNGHIALAMEVLEKKLVDMVWFVPCVQNPTKPKHMFDYETRLKMCGKVADEMNRDGFCYSSFPNRKVDVSDVERYIKEPVVYTYMVLEELKKMFPVNVEFCIICASDITNQIRTWKNGEWILENFEVINLVRMGQELEGEAKREIGIAVGSSDIRSMIQMKTSPYPYVPLSVMEEIRKRFF